MEAGLGSGDDIGPPGGGDPARDAPEGCAGGDAAGR